MALRGTLDTFALPDVLRLLAGTQKSGRLRLTGDRGTGSIWVGDGAITGVEATHAPHAKGPGDALFELLRFQEGSFTFDAGATTEPTIAAQDVESVLTEAETLLDEWREIERVVPSMDLWVSLSRVLPGADVTIDQDRWSTIVAVGAGATVRRIGDELCLGELPVSRSIARLVDDGLVEVSSVAPAAPSSRTGPEPVSAASERPVDLTSLGEGFDALDDAVDPVDELSAPAPEFDPVVDVMSASVAEPEVRLDDTVAAPRPGPRARRARPLAPPPAEEQGLFVPLDLPGREGPGSYDGPAFVEPADEVALAAELSPSEEIDELAAAFPGLANRVEAAHPVDPRDEEIASQLASLSPKAAQAIRSAASSVDTGESDPGDGSEQPISRGLLLKFLSSVKS